MQNLQSTKLMRKAQVDFPKSELEKQHQFDIHYQRMMQKLDMKIRGMKRHLGLSPDKKENMRYDPDLITWSTTLHQRQTRGCKMAGELYGLERKQSDSISNVRLYNEDEQLQEKYSEIRKSPDIGAFNFEQSDGDALRNIYELYNSYNAGDVNGNISSAYNNLAHFINSLIVQWGEKRLEDQKFKTELYKTEICRSYAEFGLCRYGKSCRFAHGRGELRVKPKPHWKYKTAMCKKFLAGYCPYGSRCNFVHMPHEQQRPIFDPDRSLGFAGDSDSEDITGKLHRNPISTNLMKALSWLSI